MSATWQAQWARMSPRERAMVALAAVAVGLTLLIVLGVRPAWNQLQKGPARLQQLDTELQAVQRAALEAQALRQVAPVPAAQAQAALQAATATLGAQAQLNVQGERATVQFQEVPAEALIHWLGEARRAARARPVQAQLQRGASGNHYSGTVVLAWSAQP